MIILKKLEKTTSLVLEPGYHTLADSCEFVRATKNSIKEGKLHLILSPQDLFDFNYKVKKVRGYLYRKDLCLLATLIGLSLVNNWDLELYLESYDWLKKIIVNWNRNLDKSKFSVQF